MSRLHVSRNVTGRSNKKWKAWQPCRVKKRDFKVTTIEYDTDIKGGVLVNSKEMRLADVFIKDGLVAEHRETRQRQEGQAGH